MKTLALFFHDAEQPCWAKSGKVFLPFQILLLLIGLVSLYLSFWAYRFPGVMARTAADSHAAVAIELAEEAVTRPIAGVRNSLSLLSRLPVLRQMRHSGSLHGFWLDFADDLRLLADSYEAPLAIMLQQVFSVHNNLVYWSEMPMALLRRLAIGTGMLHDSEDDEEGFAVFMNAGDNVAAALPDMLMKTTMVRSALDFVADHLVEAVSACLPVIYFVDRFLIVNQQSLEDLPAVENLFAAALNDDLIKALVIKDLQGQSLAQVGDDIAATLRRDSRDCRAIGNGSPFFCGPVAYDSAGQRSVWWVAVPVRNSLRNPVACLSAIIDLSYLSRLAEKLKVARGIELYLTDQNGVVIGHVEQKLVAEQVNLGGETGLSRSTSRRVHISRNIQQSGMRYLPAWSIFVNVQSDVPAGFNLFLQAVCVILLAAVGMYVLSCSVVRIFIYMNGEN